MTQAQKKADRVTSKRCKPRVRRMRVALIASLPQSSNGVGNVECYKVRVWNGAVWPQLGPSSPGPGWCPQGPY